MKIHVIGSGSSGNCIALSTNSGNVLLLDLGLTRKRIVKELGYRTDNIVGACVTHEHTDHSKSIADFELMGIDVWKPYTGATIQKHRFKSFTLFSFDIPHDEVECRGFVICADGHRILYLTDAQYCKWNFKHCNIDTIIVECNYQQKYVDLEEPKTSHVFMGHMELQTCIEFLKSNQTKSLKNVILCHMSDWNADEEKCAEFAQNTLGDSVAVSIARKGLMLEI